MICIPCRRYQARYSDGKCLDCGGRLKSPPRNWAPPKRSNKKAWREIERGNWLWDDKRVKRAYRKRSHYHWIEWTKQPRRKKGQPEIYMAISRLDRPDMPGGARPHWLND